MKKILGLLLSVFSVLTLASCSNKIKYDVVSTNFIGYDIAKTLDCDIKCTMLLEPGEELHDYSPTVSDIEKVINCKLFIYNGGESDAEFVEKDILKEINKKKTKVVNLMEAIKNSENGHLYGEEGPNGKIDEEDEEYDEHVWMSFDNICVIAGAIRDNLEEITGKILYVSHERFVCNEMPALKNQFEQAINDSNKNLVVFADRFPALYFVKELNLNYDAAFKGCETNKEANPKTIERLTKDVLDNDIKVIFTIELSEANIADIIINNCKKQGKNVSKRTFYTMHNVSKTDYDNGVTYLDYMNMNLESLKEALK